MSSSSKKNFEFIVSRTKIYIVIIAILLITICYYNNNFIIPAIIFFILIVAYSIFTNTKRNMEISKHIQELTLNVDSAAKSSLINSPFPLIIMENNGNIVWKSSKFVNEFINIDINNYLDELIKVTNQQINQNLNDKSKNRKIETDMIIGNKLYEIKGEYVKTKQNEKKHKTEYMVIFYFFDKTEHNNLLREKEELKTCVGMIVVDNYEEVMQRIPTETRPQVAAELEKNIYDWVLISEGLVVKNERDRYTFIFKHKFLQKVLDTKFNILDKVKEIKLEDKINLTLSISLAVDGDSIYEQSKTANNIIDLALGRGGDQAVVLRNGKYDFFGGKTQELEKRTRVKARIIAIALEKLIKESENVIIMGHKNPDMDSIGSSLGIAKLAKVLEKDTFIISETAGKPVESFMEELNKDEKYEKLFINKQEALNKVTENTVLIIVDTHKKGLIEVPELLQKTDKVVIIDHHRRVTDCIENAILLFHEVYASSAAELVTEVLQYTEKEVKLDTIEAEALYGGIMVDTKNFTLKTGVRTFEAAAYLKKSGIDIIKIKKWFQSDLESYNLISDVVRNAEIIEDNIGIAIYDKQDNDVSLICAKAADELLTISNVIASFVIGNIGNKICISGRSLGDVNVQVILEKLRRRRTYNISRCTG